jgi:hypothetical protein
MWKAKVGPRLAQAGAAAAMLLCSIGAAWGIGGTIGGTYQDQVALTSTKKDMVLKFKFSNASPLVVTAVTCQIQSSTPPPYEVSLSQSNPAGVLIFLPVVFVGQTSSKNVYSAFATGLGYGVSKGERPEVLIRWAANGAYDAVCSLVGKN